MILRRLFVACACVVAQGCGDDVAPASPAQDAAVETSQPDDVVPSELAPDGPADVARDDGVDVARDASTDVAMDVARDVGADVARDLGAVDGASDGTGSDVVRPPGSPAFPFGSHPQRYATGAATPGRTRAVMDAATASFYDRWKAAYLRQRCGAGRYLVDTGGETTGMTESEAHGWGMVIVAYMAGHDPDAHSIFDGMVRFYQDHPSAVDGALMAWAQGNDCRDVGGADAATDGDLDIAYALLLAERQWGNGGALDYGRLARRSIAAILRREVHPTSRTLLVGDWATSTNDRDGTRLSDYMLDHLRSFGTASGDATWTTVLTRSYDVVTTLQRDFTADGSGSRTGLLPDFAVGMNARAPRPAPARWLESAHDGHFYWNACRTPWRVATDFLLHGDTRSRDAARTMTAWARRVTADMPARIGTGYQLDGTRISAGAEVAFVAPFAVAASVDSAYQPWLDALWNYLVNTPFSGAQYYGNTIRMQVLLTVSGNLWAP